MSVENRLEIYNFRYFMEMACGGDHWRASGIVPNHPIQDEGRIFISTPVEFDEENLHLTTASGRKYKICSFDGDSKQWIEQIKLDIQRGGYEVH